MAGNPCFALLWIIVLFIAWFAAGLASGLFIFLQPFEACFGFIRDANSCLENFITWYVVAIQKFLSLGASVAR